MATAVGNFSARPNHRMRLEVFQMSREFGSNSSTLGWELWAEYQNGVGSVSFDNAGSWTVNIDGQIRTGGGWNYDFRNGGSKLLGSGTLSVVHNADGSRGVGFSASVVSGSTLGNAVGSSSFQLMSIPPPAPPAPSASASVATLLWSPVEAGGNIRVNMNRTSTAHNHAVFYSFGSVVRVLISGNVQDFVDWSPPLSLLDQIPNATIGNGGITVETWSGPTFIGTMSIAFQLTAPASVVPTLGAISTSEAAPGLFANVGAFVQSISRVAIETAGQAGALGSTIVSRTITIAGQTINASSGTTEPITVSGTVPIVATITDSRGRTATRTANITVLPYSTPTINAIALQRTLASGAPSEEGTTVSVSLNAAVQSIVNVSERNALSYRISTRQRGATAWTLKASTTPGGIALNAIILVSTYDTTLSYEVFVEVIDDFSTVGFIGLIATSKILMAWGENSVGIGKFVERGTLDVAGQIFQNNGEAVQSEIPAGFIMANAGPTTQAGWLDCNGQLASRVTHARLFAAIGVRYGAGDGTTTFNVPNYRGRFLVSANPGVDGEYDTLGETGGSKTHTLVIGEMPTHSHGARTSGDEAAGWALSNAQSAFANRVLIDSAAGARPQGNAGGGGAHNNLPPYAAVNYAIKI